MKKRFQNVLQKTNRKSGGLVCVCVACLTLISGAMVGCSAAENLPYEVQANTSLTNMAQTIPPADDSDILYDPPKTDDIDTVDTQLPTQAQDAQEGSVENLSADALEIKNLAEEVFEAYYGGDMDALQRLLPESYDWGIDVYEGSGTVSDITLKGLPEAGEQPEGTVMAVSVEHRNSDFDDDMLVYLTIELVKQKGRWEIQFYGLEG